MMKVNTKIKLKEISIVQIIEAITAIHQVPLPNKPLTILGDVKIINTSDIIAYHIKNEGIYEYIYRETTHELYIHIESNDKQHAMIEWIVSKQWVDDSDVFYLTNKQLRVKELADLKKMEGKYPIVYMHQNDYSDQFYQKLSSKLRGLAYVVYGNDMVDEMVCSHYQMDRQSFSILYNHDLFNFKYSSEKELIDLVTYRIENYVNHRIYTYPFNFKELHKHVLMEMLKQEVDISSDYKFKVDTLKKKEVDLLAKIQDIEDEINKFQTQIAILEARLDSREGCPIILKSKEKDLYEHEHTEILITLLEEELYSLSDADEDRERKEIILRLLNLNKKYGIREKYIEDIRIALEPISRNIGEKEKDIFRRLGIFLREDTNGRYKGAFCDDSRYLVTISSSSSDMNAGHNLYRDIRNFYF